MRRNRMHLNGKETITHCITRTTNGDRLFDSTEKEFLRRGIWATAEFCGIQILTYCILSNHFHVIIKTPIKARADAAVDDVELVRRYRALYPDPGRFRPSAEAVERLLGAGGEEAAEMRKRLIGRMHDVSFFMRLVKQRFSIWYNRTHGRFGTLWAERFRSVLVEGSGGGAAARGGARNAAAVCAAYIDLNPVRAGLVTDPKDYRFCGYSEAEAGREAARAGICELLQMKDQRSAVRTYRSILFGKGSAPAPGKDGRAARIDQGKARRVIENGGMLPLHELLRLRVRYFSDGAALGSRAFVEEVFRENRENFGRRRRTGARPMRGADWGGLTALRELRREVFGVPEEQATGR